MAFFPTSPLLLLITLLSIGSTAQAQFFPNVTLAAVVTCTNTSLATAQTFSTIPQAKVDVVCGITLFRKVTKSTTTNTVGLYSIEFSPFEILFNNPELCHLEVTIPPGSCTFDPSGGALKFPIIATKSGFGAVTSYVPGAASYTLQNKL